MIPKYLGENFDILVNEVTSDNADCSKLLFFQFTDHVVPWKDLHFSFFCYGMYSELHAGFPIGVEDMEGGLFKI